MRTYIFIFFFLSLASFSFGQRKCMPEKAEVSLPKNPKAGKCYVLNFDYNSTDHWKEKDCDSLKPINGNGLNKISGKKAVVAKRKQIKFKKYQEYLIDLGYDLELTCKFDKATVIAHKEYLKDKKKAAKKEAKRLKKAKRDASKKH